MTSEEYVVKQLQDKEEQIEDMKITIDDLYRKIENLTSKLESVTDVICAFMRYSAELGIMIDMISERYDVKAFNALVEALEIDLSNYADKRSEADEK